jgi:shikimate dehydrogenase
MARADPEDTHAATRLGVLGWPVAHSRSPAMQNAALQALGLTGWRYQHLPVPPEAFEETVRALGAAGFKGANVTIPHKQAALAVAGSASDAARAIGAANTLTFDGDEIHADNTDAPGFLAALPEPPQRGASALVLGAGGSARAVVHALVQAGTDVYVWNRTPERASSIVQELGGRAVEDARPAELLVNCTAVGLLQPSTDLEELPVSADSVGTYATVVDLVYRPGGTALIGAAASAGCRTVDGLEVLVRQGALSLEAWTGLPAPVHVMREAALGGPPTPPHEPPRPSASATRERDARPSDGGGARS